MQSLVGGSEKYIDHTRRYLPPETWWHIFEFLPLDSIFHLANLTTRSEFPSILAWGHCLQWLNFVELNLQQKLTLLRKLFWRRPKHVSPQLDDFLKTLKTLLRLMKEPLGVEFRRDLLEEAIRQNDGELASLSLLHAKDEKDLALGLILAVKKQQSDMIKYFLAQGAQVDIDWVSGEPQSSLQIACDSGDMRVINLLLRYDHFNRTILHVAAYYGCYQIVKDLQKNQELERLREVKCRRGQSPIQYAVFAADVQMVQLLASLGCSIHVRGEEGYNLLHIVVTRSMETPEREEAFQALIKWLIAEGCDHTALNDYGQTPLECAESHDSPQWAVAILQKHTIESTDTGVDEAIAASESVNFGQDRDHPIMITDDEEERPTSQHSRALTGRGSVIPAPYCRSLRRSQRLAALV